MSKTEGVPRYTIGVAVTGLTKYIIKTRRNLRGSVCKQRQIQSGVKPATGSTSSAVSLGRRAYLEIPACGAPQT